MTTKLTLKLLLSATVACQLLACEATKSKSNDGNSSGSGSGASSGTNNSSANQTGTAAATTTGASLNLTGTWVTGCVTAVNNMFNGGSFTKQYVYTAATVSATETYYGDAHCATEIGHLAINANYQVTGADASDNTRADINYTYTAATLLAKYPLFYSPTVQAVMAQTNIAACTKLQQVMNAPQDVLGCFFQNTQKFSIAKIIGGHLHFGEDDGNGHDGSSAANRLRLLGNLYFTQTGTLTAPYQPANDALGNAVCFGIIGGSQTTAYPAVVRLAIASPTPMTSTSVGGFCTGTFISPNTVLTAAHCFKEIGATQAYLAPGRMPLGYPFLDDLVYGVGIPSSNVFFPASFQDLTGATATGSALMNDQIQDLAIVVFPQSVAPATMGITNVSVPVNTAVTMVGFGVSTYGSSGTSDDGVDDELKRVGQNIVTGSQNGELYLNATTSPTPGPTTGVVGSGDSGGPLIANNVLVGVAKADVNTFSLYVDAVSPVLDSLIQQANQVGANIPPRGTAGQTFSTAAACSN